MSLLPPTKHVGSFLLLIFIATFNPVALWPGFPVSLEPISVFLIGVLLFYKITITIGFKAFFNEYKAELILLTAYFSVCLISLYLNRDYYQDGRELIRYGATFIVISAAFPACLLLFSLPQSDKGWSLSRNKYANCLPWGYFAALAIMVIWQYLHFDSSKSIGQYFVASELWPGKNTNGFFRVVTDVAPVLALLVIAIWLRVFTTFSGGNRNVVLPALLLLFVAAGAVTGSRVFILMLLSAAVFWLLRSRFSSGQKSLWLMTIFLVVHGFVAISNPAFMGKFDDFIPYMQPFYFGVPLHWSDFTFNVSEVYQATPRAQIWSKALALFQHSPVFGVTSGAVRLADAAFQNTHNLIIQAFVNSGVVGVVILSLLAWRIRQRLANILVIVLVIALLVDFPLEHSMPWVVAVAYILVQSMSGAHIVKVAEGNLASLGETKYQPARLAFLLSFCVVAAVFGMRYLSLVGESREIRFAKQINTRMDWRMPILIDTDLVNTESFKDVERFHWYKVNVLPTSLTSCHYAYLPNRYSLYSERQRWLELVNTDISECPNVDFSVAILTESKFWLADTLHWHGEESWNFFGTGRIFSPLVELSAPLTIEFDAKGAYGLGSWPILQVTLLTAGREEVHQQQLIIDNNAFASYKVRLPTVQKGLYFLQLVYINDAADKATKQDRNMWIKKASIRLVD